jgi:hypothetical protein
VVVTLGGLVGIPLLRALMAPLYRSPLRTLVTAPGEREEASVTDEP